MPSQIYRRGNANASTVVSTSTATQSPTASVVTGSPPGPFNKNNSSSFFTFLVALLLLVLASAALVIRAIYLRRRFRNQVQAAINAGILNPSKPPVQQTRPELYEINVRSIPDHAVDWHNLLPISVTPLLETTTSSPDRDPKSSTLPFPSLTIRQRLNQVLGHSYVPNPTNDTPNDYPEKQHPITIASQVQVAVLIAMPSERPTIPPLYELDPEDDPKGKRRDSSLHYDVIPDVIFGLSSLFVEPSPHTI